MCVGGGGGPFHVLWIFLYNHNMRISYFMYSFISLIYFFWRGGGLWGMIKLQYFNWYGFGVIISANGRGMADWGPLIIKCVCRGGGAGGGGPFHVLWIFLYNHAMGISYFMYSFI